MNKIKTKNRLWDYLMLILFLSISGGQFFYLFYGRFFVSLFFVASIFYHFKKYHGFNIKKSFVYVVIGSGYVLFHYFYLYPKHVGNTFLPEFILFIGSYFFLSSFTFSHFRTLYLNTVTLMAILSIIIFFLVESYVVSPSYVHKGTAGAQMFFFHTMGWGSLFGRLAGIYWEPGAYQIILNMAFLFYVEDIKRGNLQRQVILRFVVIALALLMTQSTAGYFMLGLLVIVFFVNKITEQKNLIRTFVFGSLSIGAVGILITSETIQHKLAQEDEKGSSYEIRKADNLAMVQMTIERPLIGYGKDSEERAQRSFFLDNVTNSNGMLAMLSTYGGIYFLMWIYFLVRGLLKIYSKNNVIVILGLFLFLNAFEVFWYFPVAFVFHFISVPLNRNINEFVCVNLGRKKLT